MQTNSNDTASRISKVRHGLESLAEQLHADVRGANDPRAKALFETTAEVVKGLATAFAHYEGGKEEAFRQH